MKNIRNTGIKIVKTLQLVYASDGTPVVNKKTGKIITKPNKPGDPDYIAPYLDYSDCPTLESPIYPSEHELFCSLEDVEINIINSFLNGAFYTFVVGVNKTDTIYEFLNPITGVWNKATIGKNQTSYTVPANGQLLNISVRKETCEVEKDTSVQIPHYTDIIPNNTIIITGYDCNNPSWVNEEPKITACGKNLQGDYEECVVYVKQINNCDNSWRWIPDISIPSQMYQEICNC